MSKPEGRWTNVKTWESQPPLSHSGIKEALIAAREYIAYDAGQKEADRILGIINDALTLTAGGAT